MFTVEALHGRVDDVLGAGPVDVRGAALLAENLVCENEIEGEPLSGKAARGLRSSGGKGRGRIPHRSRSGWRAGW
jgi:hypothetical protein